jgi:hypothetical protein
MNKFTKIFLVTLYLIFVFHLSGEPISIEQIELKMEELKRLTPEQRKEKIESMDFETTSSLLSFLRYKYIKENSDMEIVFSLYDQLANKNAIDLSQKRLNRLLIVIIFTLFLFSFYLTFILINQYKIIKELKELYPKELDEFKYKGDIFRG